MLFKNYELILADRWVGYPWPATKARESGIASKSERARYNESKRAKYNKMLSYRRETALQGTLVLAERGRLELAVRFNSLSYVHIVHAVQNTVDSCINSATDRRGHLAHLYKRRNPYPNLVLGGVCQTSKNFIVILVFGPGWFRS